MKATALLLLAIGVVAVNSLGVPSRIILDDNAANFAGNQLFNATYQPCLKDAYGQGYHQGGRESSMAQYIFEAELDGCYEIAEWHAGRDPVCSRHLSDGVQFKVQYGKGKKAYTWIDQSQNGGQWNTLGALPFFKGWTNNFTLGGGSGALARGAFVSEQVATTLSQGGGHECKSGSCFWASDAFRLTWVSNLSVACRVTTTTSTTMFSMASLSVGEDLTQVVVNDAAAMAKSAWQMYSANQQRRSQDFHCGWQGWGQNFHYLNPKHTHDADTAATFVFDPPEDGCYLVEEFHPAHTCSHSFSREAQLIVHYSQNLSLQVTIDQTEFGNQWNSVASLPFYKGHQGKVEVRHPLVGDGLVVADAFRFTKVSDTCLAASSKLVAYSRLRQHPMSVTLDPNHAEKAQDDTVRSCDSTALWGRAHAVDQGEASAIFGFLPPSTGCYRLDEFHPEDSEACSLAKSADIHVGYRSDKSWKGAIALKTTGGQWNTIRHFPFYAGLQANITSRRASALPDNWVADSFRLTKVAENCYSVPHSALLTLRITGVDLHAHELPDGQLTTHADLRLALHKAVVAASGLEHRAVRLIGLRSGSIIADFEFSGSKQDTFHAVEQIKKELTQQASSVMVSSLCDAAIVGADPTMQPHKCGVQLLRHTTVEPPPSSDVEDVLDHSDNVVPLVVGVAVGAALILACALLVVGRRFCKSRHLCKSKHVEQNFTNVLNHEVSKKVKDHVSQSACTAIPSETQDFDEHIFNSEHPDTVSSTVTAV